MSQLLRTSAFALLLAALIGMPSLASGADSAAVLPDPGLTAALFGPAPVAQTCNNWTEYVTYYSDSTKTQEVGWCEFACYCQTYCEGQQTPYFRRYVWPGCL
jgi:hypothetical protein